MKIKHVRTHILQAALSQPFAYSRAWYDTRMAMVVEIETDNGLIGWGECYGPARITAAVVGSVATLADRRGSAADRLFVAEDLFPACAITARRAS